MKIYNDLIRKGISGFVKETKLEGEKWRVYKCGSRWAKDLDKEFGWRIEKGAPMGLGFIDTRKWLDKGCIRTGKGLDRGWTNGRRKWEKR